MLIPDGSSAGPISAETYQVTFTPMLYGVGIAIVLAVLLKETGPAVRRAAAAVKPS
jgi:hypothetical protein